MTTITFENDIDLEQKNFYDLADFFQVVSEKYDFSYEEYLEKKLQEVRSAPKEDFVNL